MDQEEYTQEISPNCSLKSDDSAISMRQSSFSWSESGSSPDRMRKRSHRRRRYKRKRSPSFNFNSTMPALCSAFLLSSGRRSRLSLILRESIKLHFPKIGNHNSVNYRQGRRLYVGNIPTAVTEGQLLHFFNNSIISRGLSLHPGPQIAQTVQVNREKNFAFVEFRSVAETTLALLLDGTSCFGNTLKLKRPRDYVPIPGELKLPASTVHQLLETNERALLCGTSKVINSRRMRELLSSFAPLESFQRLEEEPNDSHFYALACFEPGCPIDQICASVTGALSPSGSLITLQRGSLVDVLPLPHNWKPPFPVPTLSDFPVPSLTSIRLEQPNAALLETAAHSTILAGVSEAELFALSGFGQPSCVVRVSHNNVAFFLQLFQQNFGQILSHKETVGAGIFIEMQHVTEARNAVRFLLTNNIDVGSGPEKVSATFCQLQDYFSMQTR
ncbi:U2 small nuclear RNA auxiliary factor 2 [Cichlidogyrus casuarinus]|uniref:U2 small nuclear RNA auxiliary factor 2 n=1 Tax=Cichlidogyrus casuarinus TaxID=1844966 RepID=A0ABD2QED5_9PLAT